MTRYALYYTPPPGDFSAFGAGWLGWDIATGDTPPPPKLDGLPVDRTDMTKAPRRYGFHATLKPPFRLAEGHDLAGLRAALDRFATRTPQARCDGLAVTTMGRFVALRPVGETGAIDRLAAAVVRDFDGFRAPLDEAERARRMGRGLPSALAANLDRWGYPYVMDAFRFHMTLTGRLPRDTAAQVADKLNAALSDLCPRPFVLDAVSLCEEDADGRFRLVARVPLQG